MIRFRLESGLALAVISKDAKGPHGLIHVAAPVDWAELSVRFYKMLATRTPEQVVLKAAVSSESQMGLRKWLQERKVNLAGERVLQKGEAREMHFHTDCGRLTIEASPIATSPVGIFPADRAPMNEDSDVITVLIVDDSKAMRMVLRKVLEASPKLKVIGEAARPSEAMKFLETNRPDVMTLDIKLPEMSGIELFKKISHRYQIPAVMVSEIGRNDGHDVMDAFEAGAFDYFQKPEASEFQAQAPILHEKLIHAAATSPRRKTEGVDRKFATSRPTGGVPLAKMDLLAIGSSTGGTEAVRCLFEGLPADIPPIVVVQHIPPAFSAAFADRLNKLCPFEVREARDGDELRRGLVLVAPGGLHLEVARSGRQLVARITEAPPVNRFRPSVDVLYRSIVREFAKDASRVTGIILTGMGNDGAQGLLELRQAGARTIGQDEQSCVVYGMPRIAAELGACEEVAAIEDMALLLTKERRRPAA